MLALFDTPAGYALFQVQNPKALKDVDGINKHFRTAESARELVKLKEFCKFADNETALKAAVSITEASLDKTLSSFLKKAATDANTKLAVLDQKLGGLIKEKLGLNVVYDASVVELMRGIRSQLENLVTGLTEGNNNAMKLGLAHSLARFTISFSPDKVDTMIVHAISLLDELDKELNVYSMRAREWYGVHFPEMSKLVDEHSKYAKIVQTMGVRKNATTSDFSSFLSEEEETRVKEAAEVSMGTDIADEDIANIRLVCEQVISLGDYRASLYQYLQNRMNAIAPNLTALVGELVGARLIAHQGSLINLAKQPASTVQIIGAEKALFRAIKTSHFTPKYGLIYHASLVGQAQPATKGKIARMLAAKASIAVREDALGESEGVTVGYEHRIKLEKRLREIESGKSAKFSGKGNGKANFEKYQAPAATKTYNETADVAIAAKKSSAAAAEEEEEKSSKKDKKDKKDKKEKKDKKDKKDMSDE